METNDLIRLWVALREARGCADDASLRRPTLRAGQRMRSMGTMTNNALIIIESALHARGFTHDDILRAIAGGVRM